MKKILVIVLLIAAVGCRQESREILPANVLTEEAFVPVMTDMLLLEAVYKQRMTDDAGSADQLAEMYAFVFEKHSTNADQFKTTFAYWAERPEKMMRIYDKCLASLDQMEFPQTQEQTPVNTD